MRTVIVESPYAGAVGANVRFARACLVDCIRRGEAPFASHLLYTQEGVLDDDVEEERDQGIYCGLAWMSRADCVAVYIDHGISNGMKLGIKAALDKGKTVEIRVLDYDSLDVGALDVLRTLEELGSLALFQFDGFD